MLTSNKKIYLHELAKHESKRKILRKFLLVLAVFGIYFGFIAFKYGVKDSLYVTALTWSFFVLCTPIADAGFLLDLPIRLITKVKMLHSEMIVWTIAIGLNSYTVLNNSGVYEKTKLLFLFKHILENPWPMWGIILVSAMGTFLSIHFGDEMLDNVKYKKCVSCKKHKSKYRLIVMIFLVILIIAFYDFLLKKMGLDFKF